MATEWISPTWRMPTDTESPAGTGNNQSKFENYSLNFDGGTNTDVKLGNTTYLLPGQPTVGGVTNNPKFSASIFFNFDSTAVGVQIQMFGAGRGGGSYYWYLKKTTGDVLEASFRTGAGSYTTITGGTSLSHSTWYHACVTWDGSNINLYLNGVSDATQVAATTFYWYDDAYLPYPTIGAYRYPTTTNRWDGKLGQATVFDYALSLTQINYLWDNNAGGTTPNPQNPMAIAGNAPIAYYALGGSATGDAAATVNGVTVPNNSVPSATVFDFTSNLQYIRTSNFGSVFSGKTAFSFSGWFKLNSLSVSQSLFNIYDGSDNYFGINTYSNQLRFNIDYANATAFAYVNQAQLLTGTDTWFHYAGYFDGSKVASADRVKVYINGTPATLIFVGTPPTSFGTIPATANTQIGDESSSGFYGFDPTGSASNIQLWDINLSEPEITTLYNNGTPLLTGTQPQAANLKAWWKLNGDTSTWDGSDWIIGEAQANYTTALNFRGASNDYVTMSNVLDKDGSSAFSISCWVKYTGAGTQMIVSKQDASSHGYLLTTGNIAGVKFTWYPCISAGGSIAVRTSSAYNDGNWHNVLATYDGSGNASGAKIYVDGTLDTNIITDTFTGTSSTTGPFQVSARNGISFPFTGDISNVAVWSSDQNANKDTIYNNGTPETSISNSPTSWWKLDNTTTGIQDSGSASNNGTNNGATQIDSFVSTLNGISDGMTTANLVASNLTRSIPYSSYSMDFDGTNDYIDCGTPPSVSSGKVSLSAWIYKDSGAVSYAAIVGTRNTPSSTVDMPYMLGLDNTGKVRFLLSQTDGTDISILTNSALANDTWMHIAAVADGTNTYLYLDGVVQTAVGSYDGTIITPNANLYIGVQGVDAAYLPFIWTGNISNVGLWDSALSEDQILTIYNGGVPSDISSLSPVSWWSLAGDSYFNGNDWICPDLGSGGNNGTSSGMGGNELVGDGPGSTLNGLAVNMNIPANLKGDAPNSTNNAFSVNMDTQSRVAV